MGKVIGEKVAKVIAKLCVKNCTLERGFIGAHEGIKQDICSHHFIALVRRSKHVAQANAGVVGCGVHADLSRLGQHGCLQVKRIGGTCIAFLGSCKPLGNEGELTLTVKVAVEEGVAVREVVVASVGVQEVLVGELGDCTRLTTGFFAVCGVREEGLAHRIVEHAIRVGEGALHLVEDNAVVAQIALLVSL